MIIFPIILATSLKGIKAGFSPFYSSENENIFWRTILLLFLPQVVTDRARNQES